MFQEVGGLFGVSERGGVVGLSSGLWGGGLLSSLVERALILQYRDCVKDERSPSRYYWLCWSIV